MNQRVYVDTNAREHWVTKELSRGGQGRVMRTREPDIALKLELVDEETQTDAQQIEVRNQRYRRLRLLPIPQGLTITLPQATLTDHVGYVMELLEEMIPFGKAFDQEQQIPADALRQTEWMCRTFCGEELQTAAENYSRWYTTGGARRRLCAWQKAAILVERLHGNGLVYCDFSMNNLFISEQTQQEDEAVWLIDADNLHIIGEPGGAYTPGYHAPELVLDPAHPQFSFASDSYSFAILLFESLTMQHPFHGRMYEGEDDWDDPIEDRIDRGEIPWILDEENPSNQVEQLPLATEYFLSDELNTLFARCFSAEGRMDPVSRPTMAEWSEELSRLLDCTVACPGCGLHFNAGESEGTRIRCPWCDDWVDTIRVDCFAGTERVWRWVHEKPGDDTPVRVPLRAMGGRIAETDDAFSVRAESGRLQLELGTDRPDWELFVQQGNEKKPAGRRLCCEENAAVLWAKRRCDALQLRIEVYVEP